MINGQKVLAVVPARGGSKGIPMKNLQQVGGMSLVARVGSVVRDVPEIDRAVVSTDHDDIAREAEANGLAAPFRRPEALSGDRIGDKDVLVHALETMETLDETVFDIILMLQPTSPSRCASHVLGCLRKLIDENLDSVWSVSETDSKGHPLKQLTIENGLMEYHDPAGETIIARQQLTPVYHRNGVAYAFTRACLLEQGAIKGQKTGAYIVDEPVANIDTLEDLELANFLMTRSATDA
jgi:CMP-N,N'-diacetyllegionaminic acid synthase